MKSPQEIADQVVGPALDSLAAMRVGAASASIDLTGLPTEQALALGAVTAEAIQAAERRGYLAGATAAVKAIEAMPYDLGDEGWSALERQVVEAGYAPAPVRRRRQRGDFTTSTIEAAYQYGYRRAAEVARKAVKSE